MSSKESQIGASTNEDDSLSQYAMQLATASVLPMVLKAAIELGVLEILDRAGPGALLSTSQIASQLPTHSNQDKSLLLDCMLMLLASHSILALLPPISMMAKFPGSMVWHLFPNTSSKARMDLEEHLHPS